MKGEEEEEEIISEEESLPDGSERCPFCNEINTPGAYEHCEHLFGFFYEGEFFDEMGEKNEDTEWHQLYTIFENLELEGTKEEARTKLLDPDHGKKTLSLRNKILDSLDSNYQEIIYEVADLREGECMGGDGCYFYVKDRGPIYKMNYEADYMINELNE